MSVQDVTEAASWEPDDDLIPVSAIEHHAYCARQCALIHVDQAFDENVFTVRGALAHERVDIPGGELVSGVRYERSLPIWSERLGLIGKADLVEFRRDGPYPVEYKVGRRRPVRGGRFRPEDLQLCAQALCLEEMLHTPVPRGAVFYWTTRRRHEVDLTEDLRAAVAGAIAAIRQYLRAQQLPPAPNDARCRECSLRISCLPEIVGEPDRVRGLQGAVYRADDSDGPTEADA
ncbi:MAG TPA: CRISPR-associated protein Cas4 [Dehalococcoidia bacterium]|nr:CRISPR-associated protein Cas4 [Dehalococcoidia bacterium]